VVVPVPVDDPSKHQGRIRAIPHIDGQFASYVYAPVFLVQRFQRVLQGIFETLERQVPNVHCLVHFESNELVNEGIPGIQVTPSTVNGVPHLSLTRPIYLRAHQRDTLKQAVKGIANTVPRCVYSSVQLPAVWS
jgi:U6 snRNA phosphodiesterase